MKIKGVLFDLYGTLFLYGDMHKAWNAWFTVVYDCFADQGLTISSERFRPLCQGFFEKPEPTREESSGMSVVEKRFQQLANEVNITLPHTPAIQMIEKSIAVWHEYVPIDPDARQVLQEISRTRSVALVSNFDYAPHIVSLLTQHQLDPWLDAVLVSDAVGVKKPNPRIFQHAIRMLGVTPKETIHIGDSREDIEGALGAGIHPIWIDRQKVDGWQAGPDMPLTRITSLRQVLDLLE